MHVAQGRHEQMFWIFFFREDKGKERKEDGEFNLFAPDCLSKEKMGEGDNGWVNIMDKNLNFFLIQK